MIVFFSIGIVQALFSILLISKKQEIILADKILMLLLFVLGAEFLYSLLNFVYVPQLPDLIIFPFLIGPLLYLYTYLLSSEQRKLPPNYFYHSIPFLVFCFLTLIYSKFHGVEDGVNKEFYNPGGFLIFNFLAFAAQSVIYWRIITKAIQRHKKNLRDKISIESNSINLNWINLLSLFVFGGFTLFFLVDVFFFFLHSAPFEPSLFLHFGMLIAIYSISFFGFRQEAIFEGQQFDRYNNILGSSNDKQNDEDEELNRLMKYLKEDKPYLIRNLTLQDLANAIKIPTHRVSELINKEMDKNFFTLINELRVKEAKKRILQPEYQNLTLIAIGFDSGFNSKSSYHELFKKYSGVTPAQFRKQNI